PPSADDSTSSAAPVPRPPHPMRPTLIASLPDAWTAGMKSTLGATAVATAAVVALFRKSRRLVSLISILLGHWLSLVIFDWIPFRLSCSATARTTRSPTNVASVNHQMLCGLWGSRRFQFGLDARRAALRSRAASSSHDPPRAT